VNVNPFDKPPLLELAHFGVKGMHWGVRSGRPEGVSRSVNRSAKKDAREHARAKMFYGEGAGTRRKLIKGTVEGKSKRDATYAKAFDYHRNRQDMASHTQKAKSERARKNVTNTTVKTAKGVRHILNGNAQYASLAATLLVGGVAFGRRAGVDKVLMRAGKTAYSTIKNYGRNSGIKEGMNASEFLRKMNL
jgi:hypothetical protein